MLEIALVSDQHDHNVRIRMVTEFLQPAMHVLVCRMLGNVVDKKRSHGTSVVAVCKSVSMTVVHLPSLVTHAEVIARYRS